MAWWVVSASEAAAGTVGEVAAASGQTTRRLKSLDELAHDPDYREATHPLVVIAEAEGDPPLAEAVVRFAQHDARHGVHVYVADTIAGETYKRMLRAGRTDWLTWAALPTELLGLLVATSAPAPGRSQSARVWSFLPSKGGTGNTTLAIEAGHGLAEKRSRRHLKVAIVDLDVGGGTLADALDVEPRFDIGEILERPERLDGQLVDIFTSRHSPRLDVFATPPRWMDPSRVDPHLLFSFLDIVASRYDDLLIDIPRGWHAWLDDLLRGSDGIVVTGDATVPAMRQLKRKVEHLSELGISRDKVALAVNRCEVDILGRVVRRAELGRAFPAHRLFLVRDDLSTIANAHNSGQAIGQLAPTTRVGKDVRGVVEWLDGLSGHRTAPQTRTTDEAVA